MAKSKLRIFANTDLVKMLFQQKGLLRSLPTVIRMVKAIFGKGYKPTYKNVLVPALAVVYLFSPINISFEWIPILGQLDDIALLGYALPLLMKEIERFRAWEEQQENRVEIQKIKP